MANYLKYTLPVFTIFCLALTSPAQKKNTDIEVDRGIENKAPKKSYFIEFIGSDEDNYYALKGYKKKYAVEKIDNKLNPATFAPFDILINDQSQNIDQTIVFNHNLYMVVSYLNKSENTNELYLQQYSTGSLSLEGEPRQIARIHYDKKRNSGSFNIRISEDGKYMLVYSELPYNKGEAESFSFQVLDQDLKNVWNKDVALPYMDDYFSIGKIGITPAGSVVVSGTEYLEKKQAREKKKEGVPAYKNIILVFNKDTDKPTTIPLKLENDLFMTSWTYSISAENKMVVGGFYSEKNGSSFRGTFYQTIDPVTGNTLTEKTKEFDIKTITHGLSARKARKAEEKESEGKKQELSHYYFKNLITKDDGGVILVAEYYRLDIVTNTYTTGAGVSASTRTTTTYYYYYNDILVIDYDKDGNTNWQTTISKYQSSINDGGYYSSFNTIYKNKKLYFVYNDFEASGDSRMKSSQNRSMPVVVVTVDETGEQKKDILFNQDSKTARVSPRYSETVSNKDKDEMLLYASRKKRFQYTRLGF